MATLIERRQKSDEARAFAQAVSEFLAGRNPERFTVERRKDQRAVRLFLDFMSKHTPKTAVDPSAVRARPGAPVATPLDWEELSDPELGSRAYTIENIFRRLGHKADPCKDIGHAARPIRDPHRNLQRLRAEEMDELV